ncbi:thymidine phosphorylase [Candidatus Peregrinibacteria bacterium]|nr:thymidine phosphorylase [Candidatus Peregrinibacteria bacterium]
MFLHPKRIPIRVGNKYIAILNEKTAATMDLHPEDRIHIKTSSKTLTAILDVTERKELKDFQIGLYAETWDKLGLKKGKKVHVNVAPKPESDTYIKEKLMGKTLTKEKIDAIIKDVVEDDLSDIEMTYFVSGCFTRGLSDNETVNLTKAIVKYGNKLKFKDRIIMDKHCIGGVPGNRTTMVVVPIMTALGYKMPKTSSRAITSPAGTADTMEVLANVINEAPKLKKIANKVGGFITWGGGVDLAAADDRLIRVRFPLKLDPEGMLLASIMAKKFSVSANHVLIDIPMGPEGKIKTKKDAKHLKSRFLSIGKKLGMKLKVIFTDGTQPIGNGIGPVLEAIDVMRVLKNTPDAPQDLKKKSIMMCAELLFLTGKYKSRQTAEKIVTECLESGQAYKQMQRIIQAQGRKKMKKPGHHQMNVFAERAGKIVNINNKLIANISRTAGAPKDNGAGVYVYKKTGDKVKKGEKLFTIYSENKVRFDDIKKLPYKNTYKIN